MMTDSAFFIRKAASSAEPDLTGLSLLACAARRRRAVGAEAAQDHVEDRAVHALAHDVAEDGARRADQRAGDDQRGVAEREADAGRPPSPNRSSASTPRPACRRRRSAGSAGSRAPATARSAARRSRGWPCRANQTSRTTRRDAEQRVERMLAPEDQRRAGDQALQLGEGDDRAGEGDGADRGAEPHLDQAVRLDAGPASRCRRPRATRTPRPRRTPPPGRPGSGRPRPAAAAPSSGCAAR